MEPKSTEEILSFTKPLLYLKVPFTSKSGLTLVDKPDDDYLVRCKGGYVDICIKEKTGREMIKLVHDGKKNHRSTFVGGLVHALAADGSINSHNSPTSGESPGSPLPMREFIIKNIHFEPCPTFTKCKFEEPYHQNNIDFLLDQFKALAPKAFCEAGRHFNNMCLSKHAEEIRVKLIFKEYYIDKSYLHDSGPGSAIGKTLASTMSVKGPESAWGLACQRKEKDPNICIQLFMEVHQKCEAHGKTDFKLIGIRIFGCQCYKLL